MHGKQGKRTSVLWRIYSVIHGVGVLPAPPLLSSHLISATAWDGLLLRERHYGSKGGLAEQHEIMSFSSGLNSLITSHPLIYHPPSILLSSILLSLSVSPVPFLHLWAWHYPISSWDPKLVAFRSISSKSHKESQEGQKDFISCELLCGQFVFLIFNILRSSFPAYQRLMYLMW